ncbi:MAG: hypothetical protein SO109_22100, partial [Escherichia coli]|nr:hypothetical protein [Escherichia coli]
MKIPFKSPAFNEEAFNCPFCMAYAQQDWSGLRDKYGELKEVSLSKCRNCSLNRPGFPGECFICELRLPDHRFRWKHNKLFLLLPEEYGPAFPAIVDC